jgi:hypothetical protein
MFRHFLVLYIYIHRYESFDIVHNVSTSIGPFHLKLEREARQVA